MITGDSTSALFHDELLDTYLPEYDVINRGIPVDTTVTFLDRLDTDVLSLNPSIIILEIGGNDILNGRCLSGILDNTRLILSQIRNRLPRTKIVLVSIPPVMTWKANSVSPYYNRKLEKLVEETPNAVYLNLWSELAEEGRPVLAKDFRRILPDGKIDRIHFNDAGYQNGRNSFVLSSNNGPNPNVKLSLNLKSETPQCLQLHWHRFVSVNCTTFIRGRAMSYSFADPSKL